MATYLFSLLAWALPSALMPLKAESHLAFLLMVFGLTFLLPAINLGIFRIFGNIRSFTMEDRKERIIPFVLISLIYIMITWLLYSKMRVAFNDNALRILMIIDLLVIMSTIATLFFKISVHSAGIWGMIGMTLLLTKISEVNTLFYATLVLIVLAGFIMAARLQLGVHTYREVMWGGVLGLATSIAGMLIMF
jgi:hypothetical protein